MTNRVFCSTSSDFTVSHLSTSLSSSCLTFDNKFPLSIPTVSMICIWVRFANHSWIATVRSTNDQQSDWTKVPTCLGVTVRWQEQYDCSLAGTAEVSPLLSILNSVYKMIVPTNLCLLCESISTSDTSVLRHFLRKPLICSVNLRNYRLYLVWMCCVNVSTHLRSAGDSAEVWSDRTHLALHVCELFSMLCVNGVGEQRVQVHAHLFLTIFFVLDLVMKQNRQKDQNKLSDFN